MAKRIRLSDDDGATWSTLPGNTGELSSEAGSIDDTIFGQDFGSTFPGLIGATVNANGLFKGYAGYLTTLKKAGASTTMTAEAMSLVSGKTYQVTAATKRAMNHAVPITVYGNAVLIPAINIIEVDWLLGRITFDAAYSPAAPITITGAYFPLATVGCANGFTLSQTANAVDNTCMDTAAANEGTRTFEYGLKTVSLDLQGIFKASNGFRALLAARTELIIEIDLAGDGKTRAIGFFRATTTGQSGNVGDLEAETVTFSLSVPDDASGLTPYPFTWYFDVASPISPAIKKAILAWENNELVDVQYLPDGVTGVEGSAVVTDLSLAGGLEVMNEFTVSLQITDELSAVV